MNKKDLRIKYKHIRSTITNKEIQDKIIFNEIINNDKIKECEILMIYVSFGDEVNTINIIKHFLGNKIVAVPKVNRYNMDFYIINSSTACMYVLYCHIITYTFDF